MPETMPREDDRRRRLGGLWQEIVVARAALASERHGTRHHPEPSARIALIRALEAYLATIAACGYPAPHQVTNELHLHRVAVHLCRGCAPFVSPGGSDEDGRPQA